MRIYNKAVFILLITIFLFGLVVRFAQLEHLPPSLNWDEVSHGYTAYSLLYTGKDQWSDTLPLLNFRAYGDYPTTLNLYFTVPFVAILGPSVLAIRLPHALIGSLVIFVVFVGAYRWTSNKYIALFTALFISLDPWTLFPSRAVFQSNWTILSLAFIFAYLPLKGIYKHIWLIFGLFSYHNTRIFLPILGIFLGIKKYWTIVLLGLFVLLSPSSRARNSTVQILDVGAISKIETQRNNSTLPPLVSKIIYNRPVFFISTFFKNYIGYFSPSFLFLTGGTQYQFSQQKFGVLSGIQIVFFYFGILLLIQRARFRPLLWWLILAPIPAAITQDKFAVIRSTTMIPIVQFVSAIAVGEFLSRFKYLKIIVPSLSICALIMQIPYFISYSSSYSKNYSSSWQYGYKEVVELIKPIYNSYDKIIFTKRYGEPHEFVLFFWPWPPITYQNDFSKKTAFYSNWYWIDSFSKFEFVNDWEMKEKISKLRNGKYLVISSPDNPYLTPSSKVISFLDNTPAFIISTYESN